MGRKTVGFVTVDRSDWGYLQPVIREARKTFAVKILDIWKDRYRMISSGGEGPRSVGWRMAECMANFSTAVAGLDALVVFGDRYEQFAAAAAAVPFCIPIIHIGGGDTTWGAYDHQFRRALTQLAHFHCVPHHEAYQWVARTEETWRITLTGYPGLNRFDTIQPYSKTWVAKQFNLSKNARWALVIFHPVTLIREDFSHILQQIRGEYDCVVLSANADTYGNDLNDLLREIFGTVHAYVDDRTYASLMTHCDIMIGNSSSAVIEAPYFNLPVRLIGNRQLGRKRGRVYYRKTCVEDIVRVIQTALTMDRKRWLYKF